MVWWQVSRRSLVLSSTDMHASFQKHSNIIQPKINFLLAPTVARAQKSLREEADKARRLLWPQATAVRHKAKGVELCDPAYYYF
jgi:hypothetical protein